MFIGSIIFEVIKSIKSNIDLSKNLIPFKIPKDSVAGIEKILIMPNITAQAFILENLNLSVRVAQGPSRILIPDVTAAQNKRIKKAKEIMLPQGI